MTPVTLNRVVSTLLYQPPDVKFIAFLLWQAGDAPYSHVDPLRPFDAALTFQVFTGRNCRLIEWGGRYRREAA